MIAYSAAIVAGVVVDAWILALVLLRARRTWTRAVFAPLAVVYILMGASYAGVAEGVLDPSWATATLWAVVLAHPLTAIMALSLLHGEALPRRRPAALLLLAPVPILAALAPATGWGLRDLYALNVLGVFLVVCLSAPLAEVIFARMTSPLLAADAFWLSAGLMALLVAGPVYSYELDALNFPEAAGSNVATPFVLGAFALVAFHADPFPARYGTPHRPWTGEATVEKGLTFVFDERRPKYALVTARQEAAAGRPVLLLVRNPRDTGHGEGRPTEAGIVPTRHAALRALGTAAEFLTREPGGLIVLPDLANLVALAGRARTEDLLARLRQLVRDADGTLLECTSRLTEAERAEFRSLRTSWWTLPDPAVEIQALLARSFGPGAGRLLDGFLQAHGLARSDVTTAHVEALAHFLHRAVGDLARGTGDARAVEGLRDQVTAAASALRTFAARTPADLSAGNWPSAEGAHREEEILVKASDYWRGKEMEELFAAASAIAERGSVYERTRAVFVDLLGNAGEAVLRAELAKLGKTPDELTPRDLVRLADRAAVDLGVMADVTDLPQEKDRIRNQVESIRRRLAALTGDEG